jgi:Eukaryotic phosphomannomutase
VSLFFSSILSTLPIFIVYSSQSSERIILGETTTTCSLRIERPHSQIALFFLLSISQSRNTKQNKTGSDLPKQEEQLGEGIVSVFPWNFSQNGLVAYKNGELLEVQTIANFIGEDNVKKIVNWVLSYLSKLDLPVKVSYIILDVVPSVVCSIRMRLQETQPKKHRFCNFSRTIEPFPQ